MNIIRRLKVVAREGFERFQVLGKSKIFCVGFNKTGTTSLNLAMKELGFKIGNERKAKPLFDDWVKRDFRRIESYCRTAQFFQDSPFSLPFTFIAMDRAFPGSKFVLTVRDDAEQWYNSLVRFHSKLWSSTAGPPSTEDLKKAKSGAQYGRPLHTLTQIFKVSENNIYDKDVLTAAYNAHNESVREYFRYRKDALIEVNIRIPSDYLRLCEFLGVTPMREEFPWENRTESIRMV